MIVSTEFDVGDRVVIDGDESLVGRVTGVLVRGTREPQCEVSYVHCGDVKSAWVEEWRLRRAEQEK